MNSDPLDDLLGAYAKQPLPPAPDALASGVWREIESRRQRPWLGILSVIDWRELFREPRLAWPALALAMIAGLLPAATASRTQGDARLARESLHFEVFSPDMAPALLGSMRFPHRPQ